LREKTAKSPNYAEKLTKNANKLKKTPTIHGGNSRNFFFGLRFGLGSAEIRGCKPAYLGFPEEYPAQNADFVDKPDQKTTVENEKNA
jgi:hypothetical protein